MRRLRVAESAEQRGVKGTKLLFATTVPRAREWCRSCRQRSPCGPAALLRARLYQGQKNPLTGEEELLELSKRSHIRRPPTGPRVQLARLALRARAHPRGTRPAAETRQEIQRKQEIAHINAQWAVLQQLSADTKILNDIPR
jgi:hypothetical protein